MPAPDALAYDGNLVVKRTTFGRSNRGDTALDAVVKTRRAIALIDKEIESRTGIDRVNVDPAFLANLTKVLEKPMSAVEFQIFLNKEVVSELRKANNILKTFVANNSSIVDNEE